MANVVKYTMQAVGHMFNHYGRQTGEDVKRNNEKIDPARTHLNYNAHAESGTPDMQYQRLQKRLSEIKHLDLSKRKDINVICDWCITLPENVPMDRAKEFFQHAYTFCSERYGSENVISAWVHMDETTPHMHFAFVPVVPDKDGTEKLCAKERVSRLELQQFHPELQSYVEDKMQQSVAVLNGATLGGNMTIAEMKLRKALEDVARLQSEKDSLEALQPSIAEFKALMESVGKMYKELDEALKTKKLFGVGEDKAKLKAVGAKLDSLKSSVEEAEQAVKRIEQLAERMPRKVSAEFQSVISQLDEPKKAAERRIKRAEQALARKEKALQERERQLDEEVSSRVQQELDRKKAEIRSLNMEIALKQRQSAQLGAKAATQTALQGLLLSTARQQQEYTQAIEQLQERSITYGNGTE